MQLFCRRAAFLAAVIACAFAVFPLDGNAQGIDQPEVVADNAIVVDASTGDILLDKGASESVAMASLTKLFTAFVAIESTPLDRQMVVDDYDLVGEASMGVSAGEVLTFQTLLNGMLLPSGNDAATAIARNLGAQPGDSDAEATQRFVDRANARLSTLGLHDTHLVNPHGLDTDGHYSTARDLAAITLYALSHEPTFAETIHTAEYESEGHLITNTNRLLGTYEGLIGGKTGVTDNAGYCLMQVAERDGRRIITVLLGSTPDAWYDDAEALLDYGFAVTAMPGAATRYGQITFATTPAMSVPVSDPVAGLAVTNAGQNTALVSQTAIIDAPHRSPWFWIVTAAVLAPVSLLVLTQVQRGMRRRPRRQTTFAVARPAADVVYFAEPVDWRTDPVNHAMEASWERVSPDYHFDETTEWRVPQARPERRRDPHQRYPIFTPSFSGD